MDEFVYEQGYGAYRAGKYSDECPYTEMSQDYFDWMSGYEAARQYDGEDNE